MAIKTDSAFAPKVQLPKPPPPSPVSAPAKTSAPRVSPAVAAYGGVSGFEGAAKAVTASTSASAAGTQTVFALNHLTGNYNEAKDRAEARNTRLAQELADFGPALTDSQRREYIGQFKAEPESVEAYEAEAKAARALGDYLADPANKEALFAAMKDPATAALATGRLYGALEAVARVDGELALSYAKELQDDPALSALVNELGNFEEDVVGPAISTAATELVAKYPEEPQRAASELRALLDPIKSGVEIKDGIEKMLGSMELAAAGDYSSVATLAEDWAGKGGVARGIAAATLIFGAASAVDDVSQGKYLEATKNFAQAGEQAMGLLAVATKAFAQSGRLAEYAPRALQFGDFAARMAPALGLLANSTSFAINIQKVGENGPNGGYAVAAMGDAIAVMGSAVSLVPGGQPAGALFTGIGSAVSAAGTLLGDKLDEAHLRRDQRAHLAAIGIEEPLLGTLLEATGSQTRAWQALGVTPYQMQRLADRSPGVLGDGMLNPGAMLEFQQRSGMSGHELYDLMMAADTGVNDGAAYLIRAFADGRVANASTPTELLGALRAMAQDPAAAPNENARDAFERAAAYIAQGYPIDT